MPASLDFGNVYAGTPETLPVTIQNTGPGNLTITNVSFDNAQLTYSGPGGAPLTISPSQPYTLLYGETLTLNVTCTPAVLGALGSPTAHMTITSNSWVPVAPIPISGQVQGVDLVAEAAPVVLDTQPLADGQSITVQVDIKNVGTLNAGTFNVQFYLATSDTPSSIDTPLSPVYTVSGGLTAGNEVILSIPVTLTANVAAETNLYIRYQVDSGNAITEITKNNNWSNRTEITVTLPDLQTVGAPTVPGGPLEDRATVHFAGEVTNTGEVFSNPFTAQFYLSSDNVFSADDTPLLPAVPCLPSTRVMHIRLPPTCNCLRMSAAIRPLISSS